MGSFTSEIRSSYPQPGEVFEHAGHPVGVVRLLTEVQLPGKVLLGLLCQPHQLEVGKHPGHQPHQHLEQSRGTEATERRQPAAADQCLETNPPAVSAPAKTTADRTEWRRKVFWDDMANKIWVPLLVGHNLS